MSDIKLFKTQSIAEELIPQEVMLEKELQTLIENNMELFFGVRFLKSEYQITNGRMDSIGIDENNCPVIFEYKRGQNENVINQGLFYLDWLLDHKADFKLLVMEKLDNSIANCIDWSAPCVICVANNFTKFDLHAVNQMQKNIKLVKYKKYDDFIMFEHLNEPNYSKDSTDNITPTATKSADKTFAEQLKDCSANIRTVYDDLCNYIEAFGDDIKSTQLKYYLAYKKIKNVICIEVYKAQLILHLKLSPDDVELKEGFIKDARNKGHWGTGDLEIVIKKKDDFEMIKSLLERAYYEN